MKNVEMSKELKSAMENFRSAYNFLQVAINRYEHETATSVNDLKGFTESYPFDKSFDELAITWWVDHVTANLPQYNFKVLNYTYLNTGGNCMVGIHEVWLPDEKRVVYALTNEEGCSLSVVDYISNDLGIDDPYEFIIENVDWGRVTGHEKYFELYRRCLNDYTKDDCRYFGITRGLSYHLLSDELQQQVSHDYQVYCENEHGGLIDTDGSKIVVYPDYDETTAERDWLNAIEDFKRWHDTTADREELYNEEYKLTFAGHGITLPYNADTWDAIDTLLKRTIEEW